MYFFNSKFKYMTKKYRIENSPVLISFNVQNLDVNGYLLYRTTNISVLSRSFIHEFVQIMFSLYIVFIKNQLLMGKE
jgi:hypothetical protein